MRSDLTSSSSAPAARSFAGESPSKRSEATRSAAASAAASMFEPLEGRQLMSASVTNHVLNVVGTSGPDLIALGVSGSNLQVLQGTNVQNFALSSFNRIRVDGLGGDDYLLSNNTVTKRTDFYGGAGQDHIHGGGGNDGIYGGADIDVLQGGGGADRFLVFANTDEITDLEPQDARIFFSNNGVTWNESEITTLDQGFSWLVGRTGNTRILKLKNGGELTLQRVASLSSNPNVITLADNDSNGTIRVASPTFQGGRNSAGIVIHELGHDWDSEGPLWQQWQALSSWTSFPTNLPVPNGFTRAANLSGTAQPYIYKTGTPFARPDGYGKTNPLEDFASSLETYYCNTVTGSPNQNAASNWQSKWNFINRFLNTEQYNWYGEIGAKYDASINMGDAFGSSVRGVLGFPTSYEQNVPGISGARQQSFEGGDILWSPGTGAHVVYGAIDAKYRQLASQTDAGGRNVKTLLGLPITDEQNVPGVAGARVSIFQGGAIYWSPATGAHVVYGLIGVKYQASASMTDAFGRSVKGLLGLPTSDELPAANGGRVSFFQGGAIYWSNSTGAHVVYGAIGGKYADTASLTDAFGTHVKDIIGLPTSDELAVAGRPGARVNFFQNGAIYWSSSTGAHVVYGAIGGLYNANGGASGHLGLPLNDEHQVGAYRVVNFQFGNIAWSQQTGAFFF
jgi:hypothetical protein